MQHLIHTQFPALQALALRCVSWLCSTSFTHNSQSCKHWLLGVKVGCAAPHSHTIPSPASTGSYVCKLAVQHLIHTQFPALQALALRCVSWQCSASFTQFPPLQALALRCVSWLCSTSFTQFPPLQALALRCVGWLCSASFTQFPTLQALALRCVSWLCSTSFTHNSQPCKHWPLGV